MQTWMESRGGQYAIGSAHGGVSHNTVRQPSGNALVGRSPEANVMPRALQHRTHENGSLEQKDLQRDMSVGWTYVFAGIRGEGVPHRSVRADWPLEHR